MSVGTLVGSSICLFRSVSLILSRFYSKKQIHKKIHNYIQGDPKHTFINKNRITAKIVDRLIKKLFYIRVSLFRRQLQTLMPVP